MQRYKNAPEKIKKDMLVKNPWLVKVKTVTDHLEGGINIFIKSIKTFMGRKTTSHSYSQTKGPNGNSSTETWRN